MILNMIWHVLQKSVKCYLVPLPRLSYIHWPINFKYQNNEIYKDAPKIIVEHFFSKLCLQINLRVIQQIWRQRILDIH